MRSAIYCRLSVDRTGDAASPERQESECRRLIETRGWEAAAVFVDRDASAFKRVARPSFDRMMKGVRAGEFDSVVCWKLDRLTRRFTDLGPILRTLEDARATLVSATEQLDTSTTSGSALVGFLVAQAEQESRNTSLRVASAEEAAARRGEVHTGGSRCFGYTREMEIIPEEAEAGRWMAEQLIAGTSLRQIAIAMNARGIPTSVGGDWSTGRVSTWLRGPRPAGMRTHRGVETPGNWELIIDPETRIEIMSLIAERGHAGGRDSKPKHLLSGFAYCALCGNKLKAMCRVGGSYPAYACTKQPGLNNCGRMSVAEAALDAHVIGELFRFLSMAELAPLPDDRRADELRRSLDDDMAAMIELTRARFIERRLEAAAFETVRAELQSRIDGVSSTLAAWEREAESRTVMLSPGDVASLTAWWEAHTLEDRRVALAHAVERITVHPARRHGRIFDTERVEIEFSDDVYRRADEWWSKHLGRDLTEDEVTAAREAYERLP
jgi:site-specific DNA recombinase